MCFSAVSFVYSNCLSFRLLLLVASCFPSCSFPLYCVYVMCLRLELQFSFRFSLISFSAYFPLCSHYAIFCFFFFLFPCYFFHTRCLQGFTLRIRNVSFYQFENSLESCSFDSTSLFLFLAYWLSFTLSLSHTLYSIEFCATAFMLTLRIRNVAHLVTSVNYLIKQLLGYFFCLLSVFLL